MTKKHFKWMAEYVIKEYKRVDERKGVTYKDLGCYHAFVELGMQFNPRFDLGKFDSYIEDRI